MQEPNFITGVKAFFKEMGHRNYIIIMGKNIVRKTSVL